MICITKCNGSYVLRQAKSYVQILPVCIIDLACLFGRFRHLDISREFGEVVKVFTNNNPQICVHLSQFFKGIDNCECSCMHKSNPKKPEGVRIQTHGNDYHLTFA